MNAAIRPPVEYRQWQPDMPITTGIYLGMPEEVYFSQHEWISNSGLKKFATAPAAYKFGEPITTGPQRFGKVAHCSVLEPDELPKRFQRTELDRVGTKAWAAETEAAQGRELIKCDQYDAAIELAKAIKKQGGPLNDLINHEATLFEVSFFWVDPISGARCRGRCDILCPPFGIGADLKTVEDSSEGPFMRSVRDYNYHWQNAFYADGLTTLGIEIKDFIFFPIEKKAPFLYRSWNLPLFLIEHARARVRATLNNLSTCLRQDEWSGYDTNIETLPYPESWVNYYD